MPEERHKSKKRPYGRFLLYAFFFLFNHAHELFFQVQVDEEVAW